MVSSYAAALGHQINCLIGNHHNDDDDDDKKEKKFLQKEQPGIFFLNEQTVRPVLNERWNEKEKSNR